MAQRQFRGDGRDDRDLAVLVADVVLEDEGRPRLLDLVAAGWIKFDKVEIPL